LGVKKGWEIPWKTGHISKTARDRVRLLLISNRKWHTPFRSDEKEIMDLINDLEGQYCYKNCIGCSASSLVKRFNFEKNLRSLRPI